jgi:hypothetical protein
MRINEILLENQLDELGATPMGAMSRIGQGVMAKLGSSTAQAKLDVGTRANELANAFKQWALRTGINLKQVPKEDLLSFFTQQQLPPISLTQSIYDLTNPEMSKKVWSSVSQNAFKGGGLASAPLGQQYGIQPAPTQGGSEEANLKQIEKLMKSLSPAAKSKIKSSI